MRIACFVVTAHGYGHACRQMEVMRALLSRDPAARVVVLTAAPESVFKDYLGAAPALYARVTVVPYRADVGLAQRDGLTLDRDRTRGALEAAWGDPDRAELALADAIGRHHPSIVVGDIPPVAFGAAARLGVPSVAVGNFDWAFIYRAYAERDPAFATWADLAARWQAQATLAIHLEPGPPLSGFRHVVEGGVVARERLTIVPNVRERLRIPDGDRAVVVSFGGFGLSDPERWIPRIPGVTWILAAPMQDLGREDARFVAEDAGVPYLELIAAADAVLTKPGYGIVAEATRQRTRLLYTDRGDFPEYPHLVAWLHAHAPAVHVPSSEASPATIAAALRRLWELPDRWSADVAGGERVAATLEDVASTLL